MAGLSILNPVIDLFGNLVDDAFVNTAVAEAFLDALLQEIDTVFRCFLLENSPESIEVANPEYERNLFAFPLGM